MRLSYFLYILSIEISPSLDTHHTQKTRLLDMHDKLHQEGNIFHPYCVESKI